MNVCVEDNIRGACIGAIYTPDRLASLSAEDTMAVVSVLSSLAYDADSAAVLGAKLPPSTPVAMASHVFSAANVDIFIGTPKTRLLVAKTISQMDIDNASPSRLALVASQVELYFLSF